MKLTATFKYGLNSNEIIHVESSDEKTPRKALESLSKRFDTLIDELKVSQAEINETLVSSRSMRSEFGK